MLSRILRKRWIFFRQINTNMNHLPIYLVKPLWENANSNFLRKFAQVWPIWSYRGRFGLLKFIETSANHRGPLKKFGFKVDQFLAIISLVKYIISKKDSSLYTTLQNSFSKNIPEMTPKTRKPCICISRFSKYFAVAIWRKIWKW